MRVCVILGGGPQARGPHIYQIEPSSNFFDCKAQAIGARSQSARTYLERNLDKFPDSGVFFFGWRASVTVPWSGRISQPGPAPFSFSLFCVADKDALIKHALRALQDCLPSEVELTQKNTCVSVVGKDSDFTTYEDDSVAPYLAALEEDDAAPAMDVEQGDDAPSMDVENTSG